MEDSIFDDSWNRGKGKLINLLNTIKEELELDLGKANDDNINEFYKNTGDGSLFDSFLVMI
jgi:hypothetical protein